MARRTANPANPAKSEAKNATQTQAEIVTETVAHKPNERDERDYLTTAMNEVSIEDWRQIVEKAKAQAIAGDATARKWLSDTIMTRAMDENFSVGDLTFVYVPPAGESD